MTFTTFNFKEVNPEFSNILVVESSFSTKPSFGKVEKDEKEKAYQAKLLQMSKGFQDFLIEPIPGFEPGIANLLLVKPQNTTQWYVLWQPRSYAGVNSLDLIQCHSWLNPITKEIGEVSAMRTIAELKYKQYQKDADYGKQYYWKSLGPTNELTPVWDSKKGIGYAPRSIA